MKCILNFKEFSSQRVFGSTGARLGERKYVLMPSRYQWRHSIQVSSHRRERAVKTACVKFHELRNVDHEVQSFPMAQ